MLLPIIFWLLLYHAQFLVFIEQILKFELVLLQGLDFRLLQVWCLRLDI